MLDELGGPRTYNHYPNGWAMAFNTPFKMWKRYEFNGGTSDPCIISWPGAAAKAGKGELRHQYHHAIDIMPTILDTLGRRAAGGDQGPHAEPDRRRQHALQHRRPVRPVGAHGRSSIPCSAPAGSGTTGGRPSPPTRRSAVGATSTTTPGSCTTSTPTAPSRTIWPPSSPDKLRELVNLWYAEAGDNGAFPLDDRSALEIILTPRPQLTASRERYTYFPDTAEVPESQAVNIRNRSFTIGALVDIPGAGRVRRAVRPGRPTSVAMPSTSKTTGCTTSTTSSACWSRRSTRPKTCRWARTSSCRRHSTRTAKTRRNVSTGILSLYHGDTKVGEARIKTQPGMFSLAGEGLCVGRDSGAPVTSDYEGDHGGRFTGGTIKRVAVDVSGDPYVDLEREAQAMLARE